MDRRRVFLLFPGVALLYVGLALWPSRTFAPLDIPLDYDAWKHDPTQRVRVSNSLLSDVVVQFIPWDREIRRLLSRGELPWVNRYAGDGGPLFANPQTAIFSPFTWPRLVFDLYGWAIMAILKLIAAGLCAYWFAREMDGPQSLAILSALVYATAGYTIVWLLFPHTNVFVLLPGLAAAALRRNIILVILFAALCSAGGHPETLFIGVLGIWIFLLFEMKERSDLLRVSIGALVGFLILAVQLVPFLWLLTNSYAVAMRPRIEHPFHAWAVISQILPGILGSPLRGELDLTAFTKGESFNSRAGGFIGAIILLALLLAWRELSTSLRRGLIIGCCALAVSWYPPGVWPVLRNVLVFRMLALDYGVVLFVLFGALAAGPAVAIVAQRQRRTIGALLIVVGLAAVVGGFLPVIPATKHVLVRVARTGIEELRTRGHLRQSAEVYAQRFQGYLDAARATTLRRVAIPGACWLVAGIALFAPVRRRALILSTAAMVELLAFGVGYNPIVRMTDVPPEPESIQTIKRLDPEQAFFLTAHVETFPANLATLYQLRDVVSYDVLNSKQRVGQLLPAGYDPVLHTLPPTLGQGEVRTLARLGVRFVLSKSVGITEIEGAARIPIPENRRPPGVVAGAVISMLALIASVVWLTRSASGTSGRGRR